MKELLKAIEASPRSYDEIIKFLARNNLTDNSQLPEMAADFSRYGLFAVYPKVR